MGVKAIASATAAVLLLPGASLLGVAALVTPPAAGSTACPSGTVAALPASGSVPTSLVAQNSRGQTIMLNQRQLQRAAAIIAVGKTESVPARGQLVALMAALTESSLRVLSNTSAYPLSAGTWNDGNGGDHDSLGLFQMRPSTGWGTVANLMDPVWSSRAFYGGPQGPNHGSPRGLLDIHGWQTMDAGAAAQAVEVSAYPDRYAANEPVAAKILSTLTGVSVNLGDCSAHEEAPTYLPPGFAGALVAAAAKEIGTPYVWGGGSFAGPTDGGFDCSGLVLYSAYVASGGRIRLPHYTGDQIRHGTPIPWADKQPGDLIFFTYPGASAPHHVAIYVSRNRILQAPHTGEGVRYGTIGEFAGEVMTVRRV